MSLEQVDMRSGNHTTRPIAHLLEFAGGNPTYKCHMKRGEAGPAGFDEEGAPHVKAAPSDGIEFATVLFRYRRYAQ